MDWLYFLAAGTSGLISFIELISRFSIGTKLRDLFGNLIGWVYLFTHIIAGLLAMFICQALQLVDFQDGLASVGRNELKAIGVGLAAIAVLRTDILSLRDGDKKVSIGLGAAVEMLLKVLDRKLDMARGLSSGRIILQVMNNIDPKRDASSLVSVALGLRETMSQEEQQSLKSEVAVIVNSLHLSHAEKQFLLGVTVCRVTGLEILEFAVKKFGNNLPENGDSQKEVQEDLDTKLTEALSKLKLEDDQSKGQSK